MSRTVKCNRCHVWRMPSDFISNDRNVKCCSNCRVVANDQRKKYREDHADKISEQQRKYREDHADKIKKYREDNADKISEYQKEYREDHADQISEQQRKYRDDHADQIKKYREDHADKISEQQRKYRDDHADQISEYQKEYREDHADQISEYQKEYREDQKISNPLRTKFKHMIHHSIHSDNKYNRLYDPQDYIDEEFLNYLWNDQNQQCYHCGCEMTLGFSTTTRIPTQISVQRLNNDLPHIKSNCVLACLSCNLKRKELIRV